MSGHSKWSTIKHKKAAKDAKRGKIFTKLIKELTVAARMGGGDINANPRLRTAVLTARGNSMPSENIDRAIKKGTGELEGVTYEEIQYEGYGPGGAAIIAQVLTDNKNRTVSEIRRLFAKHGGNMGETGCVGWMFEKKGLITVEKSQADEDRLMGIVLDAGAEDVRDEGEIFEVVTQPEDFDTVKERLDQEKIAVASAQVTLLPKNTVDIDAKNAEQILKLSEELEDHDDVQSVSANFQYSRRTDGKGELAPVADPGKKSPPRIILGIDPGTMATGWGVVQVVGNALRHMGHGTINSSSAEPQARRLHRIYNELSKVVREFRPDGVSLEKVFFAHNVQSALKLGQARGIALLAAAEQDVEVHEYSAMEIKSAVVGYGHATKQQVQMMIGSLLKVSGPVPADAADALAAAICHLNRQAFTSRVAEAMAKKPTPLRPRGSRVCVERPMDNSLTLPVGLT